MRARVCLPDRGVQLVAGQLAVIQLCKQGEEDLHASDGVDATLDRVSHYGLHVLQTMRHKWLHSVQQKSQFACKATGVSAVTHGGQTTIVFLVHQSKWK